MENSGLRIARLDNKSSTEVVVSDNGKVRVVDTKRGYEDTSSDMLQYEGGKLHGVCEKRDEKGDLKVWMRYQSGVLLERCDVDIKYKICNSGGNLTERQVAINALISDFQQKMELLLGKENL